MKRYLLAVLTLVLLLGGGGLAFASTSAPTRSKPRVNLGDQAGARFTAAALGANTKNATIKREYTELATPCRLYDSRNSTKLAADATRTIPLTACPAISTSATSLTVSVSAISPSHPGYVRFWANGASETNQTVLQYASANITTGADIKMSSSGVKVHSHGGPVHLVVDVAGYWTEAIYADVLTASTTAFADVYSSTGMIAGWSSATSSPGQIVVSVRRNIQYCDIQATAESSGNIATAVLTDGTSFLVKVTDSNGNPVRAYASVVVNC